MIKKPHPEHAEGTLDLKYPACDTEIVGQRSSSNP